MTAQTGSPSCTEEALCRRDQLARLEKGDEVTVVEGAGFGVHPQDEDSELVLVYVRRLPA